MSCNAGYYIEASYLHHRLPTCIIQLNYTDRTPTRTEAVLYADEELIEAIPYTVVLRTARPPDADRLFPLNGSTSPSDYSKHKDQILGDRTYGHGTLYG